MLFIFGAGTVTGMCIAFTVAGGALHYVTWFSAGKDGLYSGYVDKSGNRVFAPKGYDFVGTFQDGVATVCRNRAWGFIDNSGKEILPVHYFRVRDFSEGLGAVFFPKGWGYIDRRGNTVITPKYKGARSFSEGFAAVSIDYKWGYVNHQGDVVVQPKYIVAEEFEGGLARVITRDFQVCYINRQGEIVWEGRRGDGASWRSATAE